MVKCTIQIGAEDLSYLCLAINAIRENIKIGNTEGEIEGLGYSGKCFVFEDEEEQPLMTG